jgi:hypothetical protein
LIHMNIDSDFFFINIYIHLIGFSLVNLYRAFQTLLKEDKHLHYITGYLSAYPLPQRTWISIPTTNYVGTDNHDSITPALT